MNSFNREKFTFIYLLIMIYNNIIVQSNVEFQNENDTNILFDIKDELILKRDMRFDGSGMTTELTPYSTESVTLVPIETSYLSSFHPSTMIESTINLSLSSISNGFSTITNIPISISSISDNLSSISQVDTSLYTFTTSFSSTESSTIAFTTETSIPTIATTAFFTIQSTTNITSTTESTTSTTAESTTSTTAEST
ncbi:unnamed protein product, partial [Rotaria sordida]